MVFFHRMGAAMALVWLTALVWARSGLYRLDVTVDVPTQEARSGTPITLSITVDNWAWWPRPPLLLTLVAVQPAPGQPAIYRVPIRRGEEASWQVEVLYPRRGTHRAPAVSIASSDPFGLFTFRQLFSQDAYLTVYPQTVELAAFRWPQEGARTSERDANIPRWRLLRGGVEVVTVREAAPGDDLNRIHWPSTARTGRLMLKEFEPGSSRNAWVVLDLEARAHLPDPPPGTDELAATAAASMTHQALLQGLPVGLAITGERLLQTHLEPGPRAMEAVLQMLAQVSLEPTLGLAPLLLDPEAPWGPGDTIVLITTTLQPDWSPAVHGLTDTGMQVLVVLVEAPSDAGGGQRPQQASIASTSTAPHAGRMAMPQGTVQTVASAMDLAERLTWPGEDAEPSLAAVPGAGGNRW